MSKYTIEIPALQWYKVFEDDNVLAHLDELSPGWSYYTSTQEITDAPMAIETTVVIVLDNQEAAAWIKLILDL